MIKIDLLYDQCSLKGKMLCFYNDGTAGFEKELKNKELIIPLSQSRFHAFCSISCELEIWHESGAA